MTPPQPCASPEASTVRQPGAMEVTPIHMAERDFISAVNSRVVLFDGGMGATLEQFELTTRTTAACPGSATRRWS